jgi:homogentisate 1,2-dioxygenase
MKDDRQDGPPNVQLWSREGFGGPLSVLIRPTNGTEYISVQGPHAPRRAVLERMAPADQTDPEALPSVVATSKIGVRLLVSGRTQPMPFVVRNVDADEIHFIQSGEVKFETDAGSLTANEGEFVCVPRSVAYRFAPADGKMRSLIVESPSALQLTPPGPAGMINFARDVQYAEVDHQIPQGGVTRLLLKSADGENTTFVLPHDPLALGERVPGGVPVWKLNLANIQVLAYLPEGGPPSPFLSSHAKDILMFNLSAPPGGRAPIHVNADFDEVVHYVRGPGAWGHCAAGSLVSSGNRYCSPSAPCRAVTSKRSSSPSGSRRRHRCLCSTIPRAASMCPPSGKCIKSCDALRSRGEWFSFPRAILEKRQRSRTAPSSSSTAC